MIIGDGIMLGAGGESASIFVTGLSETDSVSASKDGKTVIGKWTQKTNPDYITLPSGYTQLEYIKATGTQFINTGIAPQRGISVELGMIPDTGAMSENAIFGSTWSTSGFFLMFYQNNIRFHSKDAVVDISSFNITSENKIVCTQSGISVNGTNYSLSGSGTDSSDNIVLWSVSNESGNSDKRGKDSKTYCRIKVGDSVVREYIPCKQNSDGAIGMYDLISNTFFSNNGTGEFIAGAEVPQTIGGFLIDKIKDFGTWTVTATNGTNTATQDVLVDSANVFNVEIKFVDANTVLLLHAEDFTDSSLNNLAVTNTNVTLSDNSKFGSKSFYFNGSNARLNITPTSKFEFGTGDFTVEMWIWPETQTNDHFFFSGSESGSFFFGIGFTVSKIGYGRTSVAWDGTYAVSIPNSSWTHIAIVRASNVVTIYVNGVSVGSATYTTAVTMGSGEVDIGSQGAGLYYKGCMDEVRVSDIARWTSNFTPPSEPY